MQWNLETLVLFVFFMTMIMIFWRPRNINEAIPASAGAMIIVLIGGISLADLTEIFSKVAEASLTIIATIVMAIVLESFRFFQWCAHQLAYRANGSGIRLFWYTNLLCFLMTILFNNDGSILITTPILIILLHHLHLKHHEKIPYLISGALVATASSAAVGVSNIVNLISLKMIEMDLYEQTAMMFIPAFIGLLFMVILLFLLFYKDIPKNIKKIAKNEDVFIQHYHPLKSKLPADVIKKQSAFMLKMLLFVILVRISLFLASFFEIPIWLVAILGSIVLLTVRWKKFSLSPIDVLIKAPWFVFLFAFSMYIIVYSLKNIGFVTFFVDLLKPFMEEEASAIFWTGSVLSAFSNVFNNHPALMIGTMVLTNAGLNDMMLKTAYLASIIGSDIGSLILPIGTLATLIWMHILKENGVKISWAKYVNVTMIVIPPTLFFTLTVLYVWIQFLFI